MPSWALVPGGTTCVPTASTSPVAATLLGCRQVPVYTNPFGQFDSVAQVLGGVHVAGWAIDPETSAPIQVHVYVDSGGTNLGLASNPRPDVGSYFSYAGYGDAHGFSGFVGAAPGFHWVCAYGINVGAGANAPLGCRGVVVNASPFGNLEVAAPATGGIHVAGWAIDPEHGGFDPGARVRGRWWHEPRSGLRHTLGCGLVLQLCGLRGETTALTPSSWNHTEGHQVCVYAINVASGWNTTLSCRTVNVP